MLRFQLGTDRWWNKPLADLGGRVLPAELAVLAAEVGPHERGTWINSRGTKSGVIDLIRDTDSAGKPSYKTRRAALPAFVSAALAAVYEKSGLSKGCPDLVIWEEAGQHLRLVEVKCPHWDRPSVEQVEFMRVAATMGIPTSIAEWEFTAESGAGGGPE